MLYYTYMIRLLIIICGIFTVSTYAMVTDASTKKKAVPIDSHGVEHPDHVPHDSHGKNPIKKIGHDDGLFFRKKKKQKIAQ